VALGQRVPPLAVLSGLVLGLVLVLVLVQAAVVDAAPVAVEVAVVDEEAQARARRNSRSPVSPTIPLMACRLASRTLAVSTRVYGTSRTSLTWRITPGRPTKMAAITSKFP
jgi:hypothetical protein